MLVPSSPKPEGISHVSLDSGTRENSADTDGHDVVDCGSAASTISEIVVTCSSIPLDATDTPATTDPESGLYFRAGCGMSAPTVAECPFMCSQTKNAFRECFQQDISGVQPMGQWPPVVCTPCLPPCPRS